MRSTPPTYSGELPFSTPSASAVVGKPSASESLSTRPRPSTSPRTYESSSCPWPLTSFVAFGLPLGLSPLSTSSPSASPSQDPATSSSRRSSGRATLATSSTTNCSCFSGSTPSSWECASSSSAPPPASGTSHQTRTPLALGQSARVCGGLSDTTWVLSLSVPPSLLSAR